MSAEQAVVPAIEFVAVLASAFSGFAEARNKKMDTVGVFTVAFITAFGGGTLRDVLLDRRPLFWVAHPEYTLIVLGLSLAYLYVPSVSRPLRRRSVQVAADVLDAVALGLFGGLGTQAALAFDVPPFVAVLFGVMTGTFGGVLRDVVLNEVPLLFRPTTQLYATPVFAGGLAHVGLIALGAPPSSAMSFGTIVTVALRLAAMRFDWKLPPPRHAK